MQQRIERLKEEKIYDLISVLGALLCIALYMIYWNRLPNTIPTHYGMTEPDSWGPKSTFLLLPGMAIFSYLFLEGAKYFVVRTSKPRKGMSQVAFEANFKIGLALVAYVRAMAVLTALYIEWITILVALHQAKGLSPAFLYLMIGGSIFVPIIYLIRFALILSQDKKQ